jgi:hypothetical protein
VRKLQKEVEKFVAREFLEKVLGLKVLRLRGRNPSGNSQPPDVSAVIERDGAKATLEIELTKYQVDAPSGEAHGSPGERLNSFWRKVQESLRRRLSKKPVQVEVSVTLKDPAAIEQTDARGLAQELVQLARGFESSASPVAVVDTFPAEFPLLRRYIRTLSLKKVGFYSCYWTCSQVSAANVGLNPRIVANLVRKKTKKRYSWAKHSEKWLLVYASGQSVVSNVAAPPTPATWQDLELQAACIAAPFDHVYFCDLPRRWAKRLK